MSFVWILLWLSGFYVILCGSGYLLSFFIVVTYSSTHFLITQNYGAFLEEDGGGFRGKVKLTGFRDGDIDLSNLSWTYQVSS